MAHMCGSINLAVLAKADGRCCNNMIVSSSSCAMGRTASSHFYSTRASSRPHPALLWPFQPYFTAGARIGRCQPLVVIANR